MGKPVLLYDSSFYHVVSETQGIYLGESSLTRQVQKSPGSLGVMPGGVGGFLSISVSQLPLSGPRGRQALPPLPACSGGAPGSA